MITYYAVGNSLNVELTNETEENLYMNTALCKCDNYDQACLLAKNFNEALNRVKKEEI